MSVIVNEVWRSTYFDSIVLMRIARRIMALPGVDEAGLFIGTPANKDILRDAGILVAEGAAAESTDLVLALRAADDDTAQAARAEARRLLDEPAASQASAPAGLGPFRTLRAAAQAMPDANLALISVPGEFAAVEARNALELGLNVMIFSDNVPIAEEASLKHEAGERGLMVMGPDCGTAIIAGVPLAFANAVPRGDIGIIGASGTGIQEVSTLIARAGRGVSHAIGTGGRDMRAEVGGLTTLAAIDALDADAATRHVVLISKPPADEVARRVLNRVAASPKPFTICFLGARNLALPLNARAAGTLREAAAFALGMLAASKIEFSPPLRSGPGGLVRGLFAGGTFCVEAQLVFRDAGLAVASNVPVAGAMPLGGADAAHVMIDLGDDAYTRGRPHPMIDPAVRAAPLLAALADPDVGIILIDVVLGYGAHPDPAGQVADIVVGHAGGLVIASVTGTDADPQGRAVQIRNLANVGIIVAESNAEAAQMAVTALAGAPAAGLPRAAVSSPGRHE